MKIQYFSAVVLCVILFSCGDNKLGMIGFMENAKVFEGFEMKKDYDKRIEFDMAMEVKLLDSLELQVGQETQTGDSLSVFRLRKQLYVAKQQYTQKFQKKSDQYTKEVNDRLNGFIEDFSKENGYDFILGSNGQGNVMYAVKEKNITEDLISYINKKYDKK